MRIHDLPGSGATVAVIDTGLSEQRALGETPDGFLRLLAACDSQQPNSRALDVTGSVSEEAPGGPSLVVARAISVNGASSEQDAIRAIEWVISNKDQYHIRALDLAFSAPESSTRAGDPLNQAVMAAWKADIVVVSSANPAAF